jgi:cellobiose-specific phosphotransferase system component IIB
VTASQLLRHIVRGPQPRRTRLHNCRGDLLDARGFLYLPHSVLTTTRLKLTGRRSALPWLGYRAIRRLDALIEPDWTVLEFGSGMSTAWLARRCRAVVTIESNERWVQTVGEHLRKEQLTNVDLRVVAVPQDDAGSYGEALSDCADHGFDFALIDGNRRDLSMEAALTLVKAGGYVFLDNTDMPREDHAIAERMLLDAAADDSSVEVFNDVCPGLVMVNQALLVHV